MKTLVQGDVAHLEKAILSHCLINHIIYIALVTEIRRCNSFQPVFSQRPDKEKARLAAKSNILAKRGAMEFGKSGVLQIDSDRMLLLEPSI